MCYGRFVLSLVLSALFLSISLVAQQAATTSPQALAILTQANLALTGGNGVNDATFTGTATLTAGSTRETGSVTLTFAGSSFSRIDLQLDSGSRSQIRNDSAGPNGGVVDPTGRYLQVPTHNCFTPAAWFSPFGWVQAGLMQNAVLSYVGRETRAGVAVDHVRSYLAVDPTKSNADLKQKLTTFDLYLDASSHLPVAAEFNTHPYDDAGRDIPSEVRFSDYRSVGQALIAFQIQNLVQGSLHLAIVVSNAKTNSGVSSALFQLQ